MHKFIINSQNILHKNYLIRINKRSYGNTINLVSYKDLIEDVHKNIVSSYYTNMAPCYGNWSDGSWYCLGLQCHMHQKELIDEKWDILEYTSLIDKIHEYNSFVMDEFWFFVCLVHFADPVEFNSLNTEYWDYSWLKTRILSEMFERNNMPDGMTRFYEEGKANDYILEVKEDRCLLNKNKLFKLFLKALTHIESSFKKYDKSQFELLNKESHVVTIKDIDFHCYKNKIIFTKNDIIYFSQFNDLKAITELPKEQRENAIYEQLMNNKKSASRDDNVIKQIPTKKLTGQMTAFYLQQILVNKDPEHFSRDLSPHLERELEIKEYMENCVTNVDGEMLNIFTDKIFQDVSSITNDDFNAELEKYADSIKQEHTAITHIKDKAKLIKKKTGLTLMKAQEQIVKSLFEENNISKIYSKIKEDIINTIKQNTQFIYSKEKDESLVLYGKNHIGFYAMKDLEQLKYHMALFQGDKIIEQIKNHYPIISLNDFIENIDNKETKFILIEDIQSFNEITAHKVNRLLWHGRGFNAHLIFNLKDTKEVLDFVKNDVFHSNVHDISYSRELYELLYGSLDSNKVAVKSVLKSGRQLEHLV